MRERREQIPCLDPKYGFSVFVNIGFCGIVFLNWYAASAGVTAALSALW